MQNSNNVPVTPEMIAQKIMSYYDEMMGRKNLHEIIREVAEEKMLDHYIQREWEEDLDEIKEQFENGDITELAVEEAMNKLREKAKIRIEDAYLQDNVILQYKPRTTWSWKKEFDEELEDIGCLHLCKSILKSDTVRHDIADFCLPNDKYIKIHTHLKESKIDKEIRKEKEEEEYASSKKRLQLKNMEELILLFKENKNELKKLEFAYENDRTELLASMKKDDKDEVFANEDETVSFKMLERSGGYDTTKIVSSMITKKFLFVCHFEEDGTVMCRDWFAKESFKLSGETEYDGHILLFKEGVFYVDGHELQTPNLEDIKLFKKKEIKEIEKNRLFVSYGEVKISGADFLKTCKTSSTAVEKLISEGKLSAKVLKEFRYAKSMDDVSLTFEMIEEEADSERRSFFFQRLANRNERLRIQEEETKELLKKYQV